MKAFWTLLAIGMATLVQGALSLIWPAEARVFDPFLLVVLYCALTYGETHGMLAGTAAGWIQDIHFGGSVPGVSALTKLLVGFVVGLAATRFLLVGPAPQILVIFAATLADAVILHWLASVFSIPTDELSVWGLVLRSGANAVIGVVVFSFVDSRLRGESRP
jgi:rod shape-determining protein MreD